MRVIIRFRDGSELILDYVKSIRLISGNVVETATFGNGPVMHRNVSCIITDFSFGTED